MANTYYDSQLTAEEIEAALEAVNGLIVPANNGKVIAVENGTLAAKSVTEYQQDVDLGSKTITANGTYDPTDDNLDGYDEVIVNVPGDVLGSKTITANGTYQASDDSLDGYSSVVVDVPVETHKVYGFHIDSSESDPSAAVTYLSDAVGMTPAAMDYANGVFDWGSWEDAFFIPRPCMLKYDGTVDYYLDPNDYSKKADGTASDVADFNYGGNAMMEWGRNEKKIWYRIVPDANDSTSASVFIANKQVDATYRCWSFYDANNEIIDHFYTAIYNGTIDTNGRLRSISGKDYTQLCQSKTAAQEVTAAELNNSSTEKNWYTEVYSDTTLINLLLVLISKSLDTQTAFGNGRVEQSGAENPMLGTGTLDDKGLFFGYNDNDHAVKVFGMENWWGNQRRRNAGQVISNYRYYVKLTRGTADGSGVSDYINGNTASDYISGYINTNTNLSTNGGYIVAHQFSAQGTMLAITTGGTSATYYCDYTSSGSSLLHACHSIYKSEPVGQHGAFSQALYSPVTTAIGTGTSLSCKPEKEVI